MPPRPRTALFITYTMAHPFAVGVFFRAVRLCLELHRRGWTCVICNRGPLPDDPKVDQARECCRILLYEPPDSCNVFLDSRRLFQEIAPNVIIFGEHPLHFMEPLYLAARTLTPPLLLLEQYYCPDEDYAHFGVDCVLLYGLRALWSGQHPHGTVRVVPPFIERVTPRPELPVPEHASALPWLTILGFDERVLSGGVELLARLQDLPVFGITLSHSPVSAARVLDEAGVPAHRRLCLPLQRDADLFGFIAGSRAVVLANGFMQIMEALALGCPAVCIHRGIGMDAWSLDETFEPFVSLEDGPDLQLEKIRSWLAQRPFTDRQLVELQEERNGLLLCADTIQAAAEQRRLHPKLQRMASRLRCAWSHRFQGQRSTRVTSCT